MNDFADDLRTTVGSTLRGLRMRACLSQAELARRSGIQRPIVARIERGVHVSSVQVADRFARACGGGLRDVLAAVDGVLARHPEIVRDGAL